MSERLSTSAWIFLATAYAAGTGGAGVGEISRVADGINHAVPTHRELQFSFKALLERGLLSKTGARYSLTGEGRRLLEGARAQSDTVLGVWEALSGELPDAPSARRADP